MLSLVSEHLQKPQSSVLICHLLCLFFVATGMIPIPIVQLSPQRQRLLNAEHIQI